MSGLKSQLRKLSDARGLRGVYLSLRLLNSGLQDSEIRTAILRGKFNRGTCPICGKSTVFVERNDWLRDNYLCVDCYSIPRQRAIINALETSVPNWRELTIHESSSGGPSSTKLAAEGSDYTRSGYFPDAEPGSMVDGTRSENLEAMTFADESFDLFITQDVFEHVLDPCRAFAEVGRVLRPGGAHVFTIPLYKHETSLVRAKKGNDGEIVHLVEPDYHGDPEAGAGWLVATEWGNDFTDFIERCSGLKTEVVSVADEKLGLLGEFPEVFVSRKAK